MAAVDSWSLVAGNWQPGDLPAAEARWFDLVGPGNGELKLLADRFNLHPLAVEDCLSILMHAPKIDEFEGYLFVVLQALVPGDEEAELEELDAFLGPEFVITYQDERIPATAAVAEALRQGIATRPGVDGIFHAVVDRMVDNILPQVHTLAEQLEAIEDQAVEEPGAKGAHQSILAMRAKAGQVRRVMAPQLAVIQRLSRGEFSQIGEANRIYFRDIYDHLVRVDLSLEELREDAEVALGTYLSAINNRLSEVMKVLSVVAALALPATVIAGIFGTNFDNVPLLHTEWGFGLMLGGMASVAVGMGVFFRRHGWW
jgi:magnesium transporter